MGEKTCKKLADLGNGLEVWRVGLNDLHEQDRNARTMSPRLFNQLVDNIQQDKRLESLPFVVLVDDQLEIVSGHHRVRAARAAGLKEIVVLVDVSEGLSRSRIVSKQLSHNAIQGMDDEGVLVELFKEMDDVGDMIASAVDAEGLGVYDSLVNLDFKGLSIHPDFHIVAFMFLPTQLEDFEGVVARMCDAEVAYIFPTESWIGVKEALLEVGVKCDIRNAAARISKMVEIVTDYLAYFGEDSRGKVDENTPKEGKYDELRGKEKKSPHERAMMNVLKKRMN